jgi:penicillin-binding protein 1A
MGYTPQLMAGSWIGCDDRFIHLEGGLGYGAQAARPIWEYFFAKVLADKSLGIEREAKFIEPENVRKEMMYDYMNIEKIAPPGAEGANEGNGRANHYLDTSPPTVPVDSKLSPEEQKVLQEATQERTSKEGSVKITVSDAGKNPPPPKKKDNFFKRLFGGKKDR